MLPLQWLCQMPRCSCSRSDKACSKCLPGDLGTCRNTLPRKSPAPPEAGGSLPPYISSSTLIPPHLYLHPILLHHFPPSLPYPLSFAAMFLPSTTFPRVSEIFGLSLSDCLSGVTYSPNDLSQWACLFMLPKCVLASPASVSRQ